MASCLLLSAAASGQDYLGRQRTVSCPRVAAAAVIDGRLDDACWQQASANTNFLLRLRLAETAKAQTTFYVCHDDKHIYFAARCEGQDPAKLFADAQGPDTRRAYKDDVIEVLLDTAFTQNDAFHFIINSRGAVWDAEEHRRPDTDIMDVFIERWNSDARAAGGREGDAWIVEVAIPFASMGLTEAPKPGAKWGFQVGREKWGPNREEKDPETELSLWSRGYGKFNEPKDFGILVFGGARQAEKRVDFWKEVPDANTVADPTKGVRHSYAFTRVLAFGPADPPDNPRPRMPENMVLLTPKDTYTKDRGCGFEAEVAEPVVSCIERGYFGKPYSPLVRSFIGSRSPARLRIDAPDGDYVLHVISGAPFPSLARPTDVRLRCGDSEIRLESFLTDKMLVRGDLAVQARGGAGLTVDISTNTTWALAAVLLYPAADAPQASRAIDDLRREFYRFPLEEHYPKRLWLKLPPEGADPLPEAEKQAGCALYAVPAAKAVSLWHVPQKEDRRTGPLRALAGPGETVNVSFAVHAARPLEFVTVEVQSPHAAVQVKPWIVKQSELPIGRGSLDQWADVPVTLWAPEPVHLDAGTNQQFVIGLTPGPDAPAGVHVGRCVVRAGTRELGSFPIRLSVLPFAPAEDPLFSDGGYYNPFFFAYETETAQWNRPAWSNLTPAEKDIVLRTERVLLRELRSHGINTMHLAAPRDVCREKPDGTVEFVPGEVLPIFMDLLKETGFTVRPIVFSLQADYDAGGRILQAEAARAGVEVKQRPDRHRFEGKLSQQFLDGITSVVRQIEAERVRRGWPDLIYDLWDEPGLPGLEPISRMLAAVRRGGGRTYLTIVPQMAPHMTDVLDIRLYAAGPGVPGGQAETPEQVLDLKKKLGGQWWDYSGGCRTPDRVARFEVGYYWWAWNFDGHCPWKLIKWAGDWRNHYDGWDVHPAVPTPDGMLTSTIGWEMAREGKQDRNLLRHIETQAGHKDTPAAREARELIAELRKAAAVPRASLSWTDPITGAAIEGSRAWPPERFDRNRARLVACALKLAGAPAEALLQEAALIAAEAEERESIRTARRTAGMPARREGNLVENGGFEAEPDARGVPPHWTRWSPNARVATEGARSGARCFLFHHDKAQPNDSVRTERIAITPERTYRLTAWIKRAAGPDKTSVFTGLWPHTYPEQSADKFVRRLPVWIPKADHTFDWRQYELVFRAAPTERFVVIWLYVSDEQGDIWMDDVELVEMED